MISVILLLSIVLPSFAAQGPCDIFASGGTPCVAAHSTTRALYATFSGALYAVQRVADSQAKDIGLRTPGGVADSAQQDSFCATSACIILKIYDQSGNNNHLLIAPQHVGRNGTDKPANATRDRLMLGGFPVYSAFFEGGMGYRQDNTTGVATGDEPETIYMVTSGVHYNNRCCFDCE